MRYLNDLQLFIHKLKNSRYFNSEKKLYSRFLEYHDLDSYKALHTGDEAPYISVIYCAEGSNYASLNAVLRQTHPKTEILLCTDKVLPIYDKKIKKTYRDPDMLSCMEKAIQDATGDHIVFLTEDSIPVSTALSIASDYITENGNVNCLYFDDDMKKGDRLYSPFFKPDYSPELLLSFLYTGSFVLLRSDAVKKLLPLDASFTPAEAIYSLILRCMQKHKAHHIPLPLVHRIKPHFYSAKVTKAILKSENLTATVKKVFGFGGVNTVFTADNTPLVSIIIPSKDNCELLKRCLASICNQTRYPRYEITVVDNGSTEKNKAVYEELTRSYRAGYIYKKQPFNFSAMCNLGAENSLGDYYLFLNDDIEVISADWIGAMVGQASVKGVGAVGAALMYPDERKIQHLGVINIKNGPVHIHIGENIGSIKNYRSRVPHNVSAVTGACLMVSKEAFSIGFNEEFPVDYNDIDLCFSLLERGYRNVLLPNVRLIHKESVSRGKALTDERLANLYIMQQKLYEKHPKFFKTDPYYNINLTSRRADEGIAIPSTQSLHRVSDIPEEYKKPLSAEIKAEYNRVLYVKGLFKAKAERFLLFEAKDEVYETGLEEMYSNSPIGSFECIIPTPPFKGKVKIYPALRKNGKLYKIGEATVIYM